MRKRSQMTVFPFPSNKCICRVTYRGDVVCWWKRGESSPVATMTALNFSLISMNGVTPFVYRPLQLLPYSLMCYSLNLSVPSLSSLISPFCFSLSLSSSVLSLSSIFSTMKNVTEMRSSSTELDARRGQEYE